MCLTLRRMRNILFVLCNILEIYAPRAKKKNILAYKFKNISFIQPPLFCHQKFPIRLGFITSAKTAFFGTPKELPRSAYFSFILTRKIKLFTNMISG